jgi:hypothetical protein
MTATTPSGQIGSEDWSTVPPWLPAPKTPQSPCGSPRSRSVKLIPVMLPRALECSRPRCRTLANHQAHVGTLTIWVCPHHAAEIIFYGRGTIVPLEAAQRRYEAHEIQGAA